MWRRGLGLLQLRRLAGVIVGQVVEGLIVIHCRKICVEEACLTNTYFYKRNV